MMAAYLSFLAKLRSLLGRHRADAEFDEEIQAHLSMLADRYVSRGMTTADAWSAARRQFGNRTLLKERRKEISSFVSFEALWQDLRFALRALGRSPGATTAIILTLMLGIGANAALYSVIHAALLKPLPYRDPDRLVFLTEESSAGTHTISAPDLEFWRDHARSFEAMAGFNAENGDLNIDGDAIPARIVYFFGSLERIFGVSPRIGRGFLPEEAEFRAAGEPRRVALISDRLFRQRFGGDPSVLGKTISLLPFSVTVVGVLPPDFRFAPPGIAGPPREMDVLVNHQFAYNPSVAQRWAPGSGFGPGVQAVARLKADVPVETTQAEIETIRARLTRQGIAQNPLYKGKRDLVIVPLRDRIAGTSRLALLMLWAAVGFVLLVACANVANLLLAQAGARGRETAVRIALGANRARVIRQSLTESILMALAGGAAGLVLASGAIRLIVLYGPTDIPQLRAAALNVEVLLFSLGVCALTGMLSGMAPALQASRSDPGETLKQGGRSNIGSGRSRLHGLLVVSEIVFALMLLSGAGLMLKSLWLIRVRVGAFAPERVLTTFLNVRAIPPAAREQYLDELPSQLEALPGVQAAAVIGGGRAPFWFTGLPALPPERQLFDVIAVTPHYPAAAGVRLVSGRWLTNEDSAHAPLVTVVNETAARLYANLYPASGPIVGRQIENANRPVRYTIIGIVSDFPRRPDAAQAPQMFLTHRQAAFNGVGTILLRTTFDPAVLVDSLQRTIRRTPLVTMRPVETLEDQITESIAPRRFQAALLSIFAALAVVLAMVGVYGVLSFAVTARTHDIGVCMALGAGQRNVLGMVLSRAVKLVGTGIALGLISSLGLTRLMSSLLYEVKPTDPMTYLAVSVLLLAVAGLAAYLPARRAIRVDPLISLRYE